RAICEPLHDADRNAHAGERTWPAPVSDSVEIAQPDARLPQHVIDHRQNDVRMPASGIDCALIPLTVDAKRDRATFGGGVDRENLHIHLGCALVMLRIEEYSRKLAKVDKEIESRKKMKSDLLS